MAGAVGDLKLNRHSVPNFGNAPVSRPSVPAQLRYSRLVGANEAGTLPSLKAHLEDLIQPRIAGHSGHVVKLMGGGVLAEPPIISDADPLVCGGQTFCRYRPGLDPVQRRKAWLKAATSE